MHRRQLGLGVGCHLQKPRRGVPSWVSSSGLCSDCFLVAERNSVRRFKPVVNSDDDGLLRMVVGLLEFLMSVFEVPKHYGDETFVERQADVDRGRQKRNAVQAYGRRRRTKGIRCVTGVLEQGLSCNSPRKACREDTGTWQ